MIELTARELLTHLFETAIDAVDGRRLVGDWCRSHPDRRFDSCIAIGKAAPAMLTGAFDVHPVERALLVTKRGYVPRVLRKDKRIQCFESDHPVPEQSSLDAGNALLAFAASLPKDSRCLVLISGGTSSLVEVPVEGISLSQLQQVNQHLLSSGKDIHAMNAWRQCFSRIKGGRLLRHLKHVRCCQLLLSDVPGNEPGAIGSGLLVASDIDARDEDDWLQEFAVDSDHDNNTEAVETHVIGSVEMAMQAIAGEVDGHGLECTVHDELICGDVIDQGRMLGQYLQTCSPGIHVWGGETTVRLPDRPGLGGRNQSLALSLSMQLQGHDDVSALVAGTDGIDGNTPCAGAIVSGNTMNIVQRMGLDATAELDRANAGIVLMATDELYKTGPTNTNVMDLVIAYKRN